MTIKETLKSLSQYFLKNRGVGHTNALLEGANNVPNVTILTLDRRTQDDLGDAAPNVLPIALYKLDHLRGMNKPLVIDNGALTYLFAAAVEEIERLEGELAARSKEGYVEFNINDYVEVQLTQFGRDKHRQDHDEFFKSIGKANQFPYEPPKENPEGWSRWQLWTLMERLGRFVSVSRQPFKTVVRFKKKDLTPAPESIH